MAEIDERSIDDPLPIETVSISKICRVFAERLASWETRKRRVGSRMGDFLEFPSVERRRVSTIFNVALYGEIRIELKVGREIGRDDFQKIVDLELPLPERRTYYGNEYRSGTISCCPNSRRESSPERAAQINPGPSPKGTFRYAPSPLLNIANARIKRNKPSYINPTLRIRHGIIVATNNFPTIAAFSDLYRIERIGDKGKTRPLEADPNIPCNTEKYAHLLLVSS